MGNDALLLLVGLPQPLTPRLEMGAEEWEDWGRECGGWEWVDGEVEGDKGERNDFGGELSLIIFLGETGIKGWGLLTGFCRKGWARKTGGGVGGS
jgi:hypothetical protein